MATDLVSAITQSFSPDVIAKLASLLGSEQAAAQKGLSAAVPGVLAGLANSLSAYDGVHKLSRAISQTESLAGRGADILKSLSEPGKSLSGSGWNIGSSILGSSTLETLSIAIARYAGLDAAAAQKLIGYVLPVVLGYLRREQVRSNLNNFGLAQLVTSQKSSFERALPPAFIQTVASRPAPDQTKAPAASSSPVVTEATAGNTARLDRASWLLPALAATAVAVYFLQKPEETKTAQTPVQSEVTVPQAAQPQTAPQEAAGTRETAAKETAPVNAAALENGIETTLERLRIALPKLSEPASAQAAVNEIRELSTKLAQLKSESQHLSAEAAKPISAKLAELNAALEQIAKQIKFIDDEEKPALDKLKAELGSLLKS